MAEWSKIARRIRVPLGFIFAVLYFWLARPTWRSMALGAIVIVPGLLIRALASGHVRKNEALATSGPYAYTRNPLYLGSLLMGVGFAVAARSWWVGSRADGNFSRYLYAGHSRRRGILAEEVSGV